MSPSSSLQHSLTHRAARHSGSSFSAGEGYTVFKQIIKGKVKGVHLKVISLDARQHVYINLKKRGASFRLCFPKAVHTILKTQATHNPSANKDTNWLLRALKNLHVLFRGLMSIHSTGYPNRNFRRAFWKRFCILSIFRPLASDKEALIFVS